jgi:hypothetical protein
VLQYAPTHLDKQGNWILARVRYRYRHRLTRLEIDGTMRQFFRLERDSIVHWEIVHDVQRMAAFFDLSANIARLNTA